MKKLVEGFQANVQQETQPCQKHPCCRLSRSFHVRTAQTFWHVKIYVIGSWMACGSTACGSTESTQTQTQRHPSPFSKRLSRLHSFPAECGLVGSKYTLCPIYSNSSKIDSSARRAAMTCTPWKFNRPTGNHTSSQRKPTQAHTIARHPEKHTCTCTTVANMMSAKDQYQARPGPTFS